MLTRALKATVIILAVASLTACTPPRSRMVPFQVDSIPQGASVEVGGVTLGKTPCVVGLTVTEVWTGLVNGGYQLANMAPYKITVYPPAESQGGLFSHTKEIQATSSPNGGSVFFDLRLDSIRPRERIDLDVK